jgi:tyrosine-specific transport protein
MVLIGSAFPIVLYGLWQMIILGTLPQTTLLHLLEQGHSATQLSHSLAQTLNEPTITLTATLFSIFALTTSILGVSLSLFDFLADGLNINKTLPNKGYVALLTFLPPFLLVMLYPQGFEFALSFAALFVSVMLGILPALMVWRARYHLQLTGPFQVWGGKPILILTMLCFMGIIAIELFNVWQVF